MWSKYRGHDPMITLDRFRDSIFTRCYNRLNVKIQVDDELSMTRGRPIVIYGPHVDSMGIFGYYNTLREIFPDRAIIVIAGKPKMKNLFGLVSRAVESIDGIIIDRKNPEGAIKTIRSRAASFHEPPVFVIYPEGHRATKNRLADAHKFLHTIGKPKLVDSYEHLQVPRTKGLHALISALDNPRCIRVTCGFSARAAFGTFDSHLLIDSTFLMKLEEVELPTDINELKERLIEKDWPEMNDILERHIGKAEHRAHLAAEAA